MGKLRPSSALVCPMSCPRSELIIETSLPHTQSLRAEFHGFYLRRPYRSFQYSWPIRRRRLLKPHSSRPPAPTAVVLSCGRCRFILQTQRVPKHMKIPDGLFSVTNPEVVTLSEMHRRISLPQCCPLGRELRVQADFGAPVGFHVCTWRLGGSRCFTARVFPWTPKASGDLPLLKRPCSPQCEHALRGETFF